MEERTKRGVPPLVLFYRIDEIMTEFIIIVLIVSILWSSYGHYDPRIDIVMSEHYITVYLWYDKWDGTVYEGRAYKCIFRMRTNY